MVRKWSYLTPILTKLTQNINQYNINSINTFKIFKATIRFKKFNRSNITRMVRKKFAKRKHKTNWVLLSRVIFYWVNMFLKNKQFIRFYQNVGLFKNQSYSVSIVFLTKTLTKLTSVLGINTFGCSKNIINNYIFSKNIHHTTPINNTRSVGLLTRSLEGANSYNDINPGLIEYDNLHYPYNFEHISNINIVYGDSIKVLLSLIIKLILFLYKINILITLKQA